MKRYFTCHESIKDMLDTVLIISSNWNDRKEKLKRSGLVKLNLDLEKSTSLFLSNFRGHQESI